MQNSNNQTSQHHHPLGWIARAEKCFKKQMHAKTIELEMQRGLHQNLKFELQQLKTALNVLNIFEDDDKEEEVDLEFFNKFSALENDLTKKKELIEELETLNQVLTVKRTVR
ncbi:unnamed protein product [Lathyrus sativus]|nr:unnamed protein product [Lathyrus sativus]